jgi:hypothetical protein
LRPPLDRRATWSARLHGRAALEPTFLAARLFIVRSRLELVEAGDSPEVLRKLVTGLREVYRLNAASPSARLHVATLFR